MPNGSWAQFLPRLVLREKNGAVHYPGGGAPKRTFIKARLPPPCRGIDSPPPDVYSPFPNSLRGWWDTICGKKRTRKAGDRADLFCGLAFAKKRAFSSGVRGKLPSPGKFVAAPGGHGPLFVSAGNYQAPMIKPQNSPPRATLGPPFALSSFRPGTTPELSFAPGNYTNTRRPQRIVLRSPPPLPPPECGVGGPRGQGPLLAAHARPPPPKVPRT